MWYFDSPSMLLISYVTTVSSLRLLHFEGNLDGVLAVTGFFERVLNRNRSYL